MFAIRAIYEVGGIIPLRTIRVDLNDPKDIAKFDKIFRKELNKGKPIMFKETTIND